MLFVIVIAPYRGVRAQQTGALELLVRSEAGAPIPGARVELLPSGASIVATRGRVFLIPDDPRISALHISAIGYRPATLALDSLRALGTSRFRRRREGGDHRRTSRRYPS